MKNYLKPNWKLIDQAINDSTNYESIRREFIEAINATAKKIFEKISKEYEIREQDEEKRKIQEMKALPTGSVFYYMGRPFKKLNYGDPLTKVEDRRSNMILAMNGENYLIPYTFLQIDEPTSEEISNYDDLPF